ncbi:MULTISPECIES: hypothetical protein [Caldilinea]|jgi:hypothetical protein|uniref:Uncharacterized protein n=1 Tax=Caldilinea aerophila (strain DSM 14535 / JCM 11387 / NBRC 104270 / STL-6-O1) TaxID=926550 RepID=I0I400_CALAS|nr:MULTISPECIES: hypothetical protein [Caldilinea]BAL99987.1 hypothetical protein CLDAP_19480 [Caldilinea aerophila DSM 14535 = NBRC 104270]GIV73344.1 MAG: hypothetical protein KatS3mg049_1900 [Caldilinea sp.]
MNHPTETPQPPAHLSAAYAERAYRRNYRTVMVRFWREHDNAPWRATAIDSNGGAPTHYASVNELFASLWTMLNELNET